MGSDKLIEIIHILSSNEMLIIGNKVLLEFYALNCLLFNTINKILHEMSGV